MARADLHVHSRASRRPSEWFLQKVGASESYTDINTLYAAAKACGMDFVTVTDHNTIEGALELVAKYPEDTFVSVEVTTYFPENNCKIHVLLFDITPEDFERVEEVRHDIYRFRELIRERNLAYSVAHGFYSINRRLDIDILERLILLFDVFEGRNGARNLYYSETWESILKGLTPDVLENLSARHGIEPMGPDSWVKGFTGGSDDHAGLFIGRTFTGAPGALSKSGFISQIRAKKTFCGGRCNDYKSFAFSIYKIFCDYSTHAGKTNSGGIFSFIHAMVFSNGQSRLKKWMTLRRLKKGRQTEDRIILKFFEDVYQWSQNRSALDVETRFARIYQSMGLLLDEYFRVLLDSFVRDLSRGDLSTVSRNLMSCFPALFISVPFFSSLSHLSRDRKLMVALKTRYSGDEDLNGHSVLWFTDTLEDLNGVSVTLESFRTESLKRGLNLTFVTCREDFGLADQPNILNLPRMYAVTPEFYASLTLNFPSLLVSMEMIHECRPDRIIISTPGPVGILGMVMAHLLGVECVCIYHTDFAAQVESIFRDEDLTGLVRYLVGRFYFFAGRIKVPTREYIRILSEQDLDPVKMSLFRRGMNIHPMIEDPDRKKQLMRQKLILPGTTLLWAGRMSRDKNLEFLMAVYQEAFRMHPELNLILCGDGPDREYLQTRYKDSGRIHFTGRVSRETLFEYYDIADLLVFPSITDTFGMVVLEAQSRGLPALVTDVGGPQEIIDNNRTGYVLSLSDRSLWVEKILALHHLKTARPNEFAAMRAACRHHVRKTCSWDEAFADILGEPGIRCRAGAGHALTGPDRQPQEPAKGVA